MNTNNNLQALILKFKNNNISNDEQFIHFNIY